MTAISKALARGTIATVAAGAMAMAAASPAAAQDRYRHNDRNRGGLSTGEVIAGVAVLGGLAAVLASSRNNRDRDYRYDDRRGWNDHQRGADRAINQCVSAAERQARRWSGSRAEVTDIRDIDRNRRGFEVKGRIAVRDDYRGRGWDRAGYRGRNDRWDEGRFTCRVRDGRVVDVDFRGIRGL